VAVTTLSSCAENLPEGSLHAFEKEIEHLSKEWKIPGMSGCIEKAQ